MARGQMRIKKRHITSAQSQAKALKGRAVQAKSNPAPLEVEENIPVRTEPSALEKSGSLLGRASLNRPEAESSRPARSPSFTIQQWSLQRDRSTGIQQDAEGQGVDLLPKDSGQSIHPKVGDAFEQAGHPEVKQEARVHYGPEADAAAKSINSHAYTIGDDHSNKKHIVMQSSLAHDIPTQTHEGTHVVHQLHKNVQPNIPNTPINDDRGMEGNARDNEKRIMQGENLEVKL